VNSTFTNNSGVFTGGIFNGDGLLVSQSTFTGNISSGDGLGDGDGGAIVNYGFGSIGGSAEKPVSPKTIKTQHSPASGRMKQALARALTSPGDPNAPPPGIPSIVNSTFTNNTGLYSGGVDNAGGFLWVAFSTFNQNTSAGDGLGDADAAGFLSTFGAESIIANNTFFGNSSTSQNGAGAMAGADGSLFEGYGTTANGNSGFFGGIYADGSAGAVLFNSIVSGNTTTNTSTSSPSDPDDNGFISDPTAGDVVGDPNVNLAPLGNYGGPTQTMMPLPGSSAICAGNLLTLAEVESDAGVTLTEDQRALPNTNSTYPGYSSTPCVDAGAVQTNYALTFTTQPPSNPAAGVALSPAPVVQLTESGLVALAANGSVSMTDGSGLLAGTTSVALSSGSATFNNLVISSATSNDILTATLPLNSSLNLTSQASVGLTVNVPPPSLSATSLSFGVEPIGYSSVAQGVTVTNTSTVMLHFNHIALTGANALSFVTSNTCGTGIAAGATCRIGVRMVPQAAGALTAAITLTDNATGSPQSIALNGTGVTPGVSSLLLSATTLSFGDEPIGDSTAAQSVTVTNTSAALLYFKSIVLTGANALSFVTSNTCGANIAAGATCRIGVRMAPLTTGSLSAAITLTDTATGSPQSIALNGTGVTPGVSSLSLSTTNLEFGTEMVGSSTAAQAVTVTNTSAVVLYFGSIALTGTNASSFVTSNTCGTSLAPGATCRIGARMAPQATGSLSATITLIDNATGSPQSIALSGTGN
jgi:hypothetical protein